VSSLGLYTIYAYKEGDTPEYDDGSQYAFGCYRDEQDAQEDAARLEESGEWQVQVLEMVQAP